MVLIGLTGLAVLAAVACLVVGLVLPGVLVLAIWASVALLALVFERYRYKRPLSRPPGPDWQATDEKFVDPESGAALTVYFKPSTGQRVYVAESAPGGAISHP